MFCEYLPAERYVREQYGNGKAVVIKASGLAAGKGVLIPKIESEAIDALKSVMDTKEFGSAGDEVVIEEYIEGEECSMMAITDGYYIVPLPPCQDHKRAFDNDLGLNTGGMGAYSPVPFVNAELRREVYNKVLKPTVDGMRREGYPFIGCLYAGIMVTKDGPKVLEFNCRFGDPETQVIMKLIDDECDLAEVMLACTETRLDSVKLDFKPGSAISIVAASQGYPGKYKKGIPITINLSDDQRVEVFHAGTTLEKNGKVVTSGGRVLAVSSYSNDLQSAIKLAYDSIHGVEFDGMFYRKDIGKKGLNWKFSGVSYSDAGVNIDKGNEFVERIKNLVKSTKRPGSDAKIGGFGGFFDLSAAGYLSDCMLVSATDGVGTKLKIAQLCNIHKTIGIDLVAMSVNDLIVQGAEPLLFLDYFSCGRLDLDIAEHVVRGISEGCIQADCALVGGETAEMPGMYAPGEYDLAGFSVGAVLKHRVLPRLGDISEGDVVFGLASSGIHSNGYSLVRHIIKNAGLDYESTCPFDSSKTLGEALLEPTRIYVKQLKQAINGGLIKSMSHITGGGFLDNIPRTIPDDLAVILDAKSWPFLDVFRWIKSTGQISDCKIYLSDFIYHFLTIILDEMSRTFNCGIGMVLIVGNDKAFEFIESMKSMDEKVYQVGKVVKRFKEAVILENSNESWN